MTQHDQSSLQVGIHSNSGGDIDIKNGFVNIAGRDIHIIHQPPSAQEKKDAKNRKVMLDRIEHTWITGFLEYGNRISIPLRLQEQPNAVAKPLRQTIQELAKPAHILPPGTRIEEVYNQAEGALLILGEPGAGKTTLLLKLTHDLLDHARDNDTLPIPVIFLLSSWAVKRLPLIEWLIEELETMYQVPRKIGKCWIDNDQILPLLDELDGVSEKYRIDCIQAINIYRNEHSGLAPTVVCSRTDAYWKQPIQLQLQNAVVIQPLTNRQVETYLSSASEQLEGARLDALRAAIHCDPDLQELITSPFMFGILIEIAQETHLSEVLSSGSIDQRRQQILATYVDSVFARGKRGKLYTKGQTLFWLAWLARHLVKFHQTAFYIERMQFDWLPVKQSHRLNSAIVFLFKLMIGVSTAGAGMLTFELPGALLFGLIGMSLAKSTLVIGDIEPAEKVTWSSTSVKQKLFDSLFSGVKIGVLVVLFISIFSSASLLLFFLLPTVTVFGNIPLSSLLRSGTIIMLGSGLLLIIQSGWTYERLDERLLMRPNQGIWHSGRHSLVVGLIFGGVGSLIFFFLTNSVVDGLVCGWGIGLAIGLLNGGMACIKHALLRWYLWRERSIPRNYPHFLNYAADRMLLRKIGGGYLFFHRLLLEYFATLDMSSFFHKDV